MVCTEMNLHQGISKADPEGSKSPPPPSEYGLLVSNEHVILSSDKLS